MGPFVVLGHPASELCVMHGGGNFPWLPIDAAMCLQTQKYLCVLKALLDVGLLQLQPLLQVIDPCPALSELAVFLLQCIAAVEDFLLTVNQPPQPIDLSLDAEVPQGIEGALNAWVKWVREGLEGGKDEAGGCRCLKGESMEGFGVDRVVIAHSPQKHGLSLMETHAQILGCHLIATLILESEAVDVLVRLVRVPFRARMIPVIVGCWRRRRKGVVDVWGRTSDYFHHRPHCIANWVFCGEGGCLVGRGQPCRRMGGMGWKWGATVGDWVIGGSRAGQVRGLGRLLACQTLCRFTPAAGQEAFRFKFSGRWHEVGRGRASSLLTTLLKVGVFSSSGTTSPASPSSPSGNISGPSVASYRSQFSAVSQERRSRALILSLWKSRTSPSASVMGDVFKGEERRVDGEEFLWEYLWLGDVVRGGFCGKGAELLT